MESEITGDHFECNVQSELEDTASEVIMCVNDDQLITEQQSTKIVNENFENEVNTQATTLNEKNLLKSIFDYAMYELGKIASPDEKETVERIRKRFLPLDLDITTELQCENKQRQLATFQNDGNGNQLFKKRKSEDRENNRSEIHETDHMNEIRITNVRSLSDGMTAKKSYHHQSVQTNDIVFENEFNDANVNSSPNLDVTVTVPTTSNNSEILTFKMDFHGHMETMYNRLRKELIEFFSVNKLSEEDTKPVQHHAIRVKEQPASPSENLISEIDVSQLQKMSSKRSLKTVKVEKKLYENSRKNLPWLEIMDITSPLITPTNDISVPVSDSVPLSKHDITSAPTFSSTITLPATIGSSTPVSECIRASMSISKPHPVPGFNSTTPPTAQSLNTTIPISTSSLTLPSTSVSFHTSSSVPPSSNILSLSDSNSVSTISSPSAFPSPVLVTTTSPFIATSSTSFSDVIHITSTKASNSASAASLTSSQNQSYKIMASSSQLLGTTVPASVSISNSTSRAVPFSAFDEASIQSYLASIENLKPAVRVSLLPDYRNFPLPVDSSLSHLTERQRELAPDEMKYEFKCLKDPIIVGLLPKTKYLEKLQLLCEMKLLVIRDKKQTIKKLQVVISPTCRNSSCTLNVTVKRESVPFPKPYIEKRSWHPIYSSSSSQSLNTRYNVRTYEYTERSEVQILVNERNYETVTFPVWVDQYDFDHECYLILGKDFLRRCVPKIDYKYMYLVMQASAVQRKREYSFEYFKGIEDQKSTRRKSRSIRPEKRTYYKSYPEKLYDNDNYVYMHAEDESDSGRSGSSHSTYSNRRKTTLFDNHSDCTIFQE